MNITLDRITTETTKEAQQLLARGTREERLVECLRLLFRMSQMVHAGDLHYAHLRTLVNQGLTDIRRRDNGLLEHVRELRHELSGVVAVSHSVHNALRALESEAFS